LAASVASKAAAQRLHGRLLDVDSNEPISSGIVTLLTEDGVRAATAVTDENGNWWLAAPGPGLFYVEAKRLGYQPWIDGPLELQRDDDWSSLYHLRSLAVELDPVEVSAQATQRYLELSGFYQRQRVNFGHFITREDVEKRAGSKVTDVLAAVPGVRLVPTGDSFGRMHIQMRGSRLSYGGVCRPRIFVDGIIYNRGDSRPTGVDDWGNLERIYDPLENPNLNTIEEPTIDEIVQPVDIAGIEVYRSASQVPVQFGGTGIQTQCGVIAIWTRVGQLRRRGRD
jgi:hypothetical protein